MRIAPESLPILRISAAITVILWGLFILFKWDFLLVFAILAVAFTLFSLFFFRDPFRKVPNGSNLILSPADGRIVAIEEDVEPHYIGGKCIRVSIFLSLFNVHINRMPYSGTVAYKHYRPGRFFGAYRDKASELNEQTCIGLDCGNNLRMTVKQIAGFVARRIICKAERGDRYSIGDRFGLICFGSRTDLFLPLGTRINVKLGDRVSGGTTIIGEAR